MAVGMQQMLLRKSFLVMLCMQIAHTADESRCNTQILKDNLKGSLHSGRVMQCIFVKHADECCAVTDLLDTPVATSGAQCLPRTGKMRLCQSGMKGTQTLLG